MKKLALLMAMAISATLGLAQVPEYSNTAKVNGIDLYYEVYGEGEPLLLLHGWTQSSDFWKAYIPAYAKHFKVIVFDLRGHGRSSMLNSDFSIKETARDVAAFLDQQNIRKTHAIGLSFGGLTLLELAAMLPERLESMTLIGTSHDFDGGENSDNAFRYEDLPPEFVAQLKLLHIHGDAQIRALFNPELNYRIQLKEEDLQDFSFRTLIVQGDRDEILGIDPAIALYKTLPASELWIVPNTGHLAITGPNKEDFLKRSVDFLLSEK